MTPMSGKTSVADIVNVSGFGSAAAEAVCGMMRSRERFAEFADVIRSWSGRSNLSREGSERDPLSFIEDFCRSLYPGEEITGRGWHSGTERRRTSGPDVPDSAIITPVLAETLQASTDLLRRTLLYSDLSVAVLPVDVKSMYTSYSLPNVLRRGGEPGYHSLVDFNAEYADLVARGSCIFLPRSYANEEEDVSGYWSRTRYWAPIHQTVEDLAYTPSNFRASVRMGQSAFHDMLVFERLVLPYFPEASLADVARIAEYETDAFTRFNHFLNRKIGALDRAPSSADFRDDMDEIRDLAADLEKQAKKLQNSTRLRTFQVGYFAISLGLLALPEHAAQAFAAITGTVNLLELVKTHLTVKADRLDLRATDLYVPFLLKNTDEVRP